MANPPHISGWWLKCRFFVTPILTFPLGGGRNQVVGCSLYHYFSMFVPWMFAGMARSYSRGECQHRRGFVCGCTSFPLPSICSHDAVCEQDIRLARALMTGYFTHPFVKTYGVCRNVIDLLRIIDRYHCPGRRQRIDFPTFGCGLRGNRLNSFLCY